MQVYTCTHVPGFLTFGNKHIQGKPTPDPNKLSLYAYPVSISNMPTLGAETNLVPPRVGLVGVKVGRLFLVTK